MPPQGARIAPASHDMDRAAPCHGNAPGPLAHRSLRLVGFATAGGTKFPYIARQQRFGRGIVDCEVLEESEPSLLRSSWIGDVGEPPTLVTYRLESRNGGPRFTYERTGFSGTGGFFVSRTLHRVRKKSWTWDCGARAPATQASAPKPSQRERTRHHLANGAMLAA